VTAVTASEARSEHASRTVDTEAPPGDCYCLCGIVVVPVGPMPVVWMMTSPSFAQT
jgi:hypothetical protein